MKKVTIYDVAKAANVSLATVSRVINGSEVVKEKTRLKVQTTIDALGYKPNAVAQGLALKKTTSIALIIPEAGFVYANQIISGLVDVAKIYKYNIMLHTLSDGISGVEDVVDSIIKTRVDGVIIYNSFLAESVIKKLTDYEIPIVIIGANCEADNIASVFVDFEEAVYNFVRKYLNSGINDIVMIEDRKNIYVVEQSLKALKKAFKEHDKKFEGLIKIPSEYRTSYQYLVEYFKTNVPKLVITNRDSQAFACINAARDNGLKIPEDFELICLIDTKYNLMNRPQISSFLIPNYDLGAVATRLLTKMLTPDLENFDKRIELSYVYTPRMTTKN